MKLLQVLSALLITVSASLAADGGTTPYEATVSGVVCSACKSHVTHALKKLPGVDIATIQFAKGEKPETQKVTFTSSSKEITAADAAKALEDQGEQYKVLSLVKTQP